MIVRSLNIASSFLFICKPWPINHVIANVLTGRNCAVIETCDLGYTYCLRQITISLFSLKESRPVYVQNKKWTLYPLVCLDNLIPINFPCTDLIVPYKHELNWPGFPYFYLSWELLYSCWWSSIHHRSKANRDWPCRVFICLWFPNRLLLFAFLHFGSVDC